jgi:hypothetical protein
VRKASLFPDPIGYGNQAVCQQANIETVFESLLVDPLFLYRQQVDEQCRDSAFLKRSGDELVSRTVASAAATMREDYDGFRVAGESQIRVNQMLAYGDRQAYGFDRTPPCDDESRASKQRQFRCRVFEPTIKLRSVFDRERV